MTDWPGIRLLQWCRKYRKENIMSVQTDHDLLVRIDERTKTFERQMENHLKHHLRYSLLAWSVALGAIIRLILVVVR